ncbi:Sodium channel protein type 11 subunit alpha [Bienertia sinuspersici]
MRHLTQFVSAIEEQVRETSGYRQRVIPRFRRAFRFLLRAASS